MPIYDYECTGCGHRFDRRQRFGSNPVQVCPLCQGEAQRKLHSVPVIYRGNGFYTTDYARKGVSDSGEPGNGKDSDSSK